MAQMPGRRPQFSSPAMGAPRPPPPNLVFPPFGGVDAIRRIPRVSPTTTIGQQAYREVDNGRANVLVPVDDPISAAQRDGIVRSLFMADHPLGAAAYGGASIAGASQKTRDAVLSGVGFAEELAAGAQSPRSVRLRQPMPTIKNPREPVRQAKPSETGQTMGFNASLTRSMLAGGTRAKQSIRPPGFRDGDARGHVRAKQLGGSGGDEANLMTLTQKPTNSPWMSTFESAVKRRVRAGEAIEYMVKPLYREGSLPPSAILLTATGSRHPPRALIIGNPAGSRR